MKTTFSIKFALPFTFQMEFFSRENTVGKTGFKANQLYTLPLLFLFRVMYNIDSIYSVAWWTSLKSPCKLFAYHYEFLNRHCTEVSGNIFGLNSVSLVY